MSDEVNTEVAVPPEPLSPNRRSLIKLAGAAAFGVGAYTLAACQQSSSPAGTSAGAAGTSSGESVLDKWTRDKTAKLGVDLTFPPIQFKDSSGKPTGYQMELTQMMMSDLGVTPQYVEIPFGQLFAGLVAGKFDMMGISATILPTRALKGLFAGFPVFYESIVIALKPGSSVTAPSQLNAGGITISVLQGSAQEAAAKLLYSKATTQSFAAITDAINAVGTSKTDAIIFSEFDVSDAFKAHPDLKIMPGPPLFVDANTYFMPLNDFKLYAWVTNWLRYHATHQTLAGLWEKWVGPGAAQFHLQTGVVGAGGESVPVSS